MKQIILLAIFTLTLRYAVCQGCSDAGICTAGSFNANQTKGPITRVTIKASDRRKIPKKALIKRATTKASDRRKPPSKVVITKNTNPIIRFPIKTTILFISNPTPCKVTCI